MLLLRRRVLVLRARPAVLLVLALLLPALRRIRDRVVEVGRVLPAAAARGRGVVGVVVLLVLGAPEITGVGAAWAIGGVRGEGGVGALALLVRLTFEGGGGVAVLVAVGPLRPALMATDGAGVDKAVPLRPLGRACVRLIVTDVLRRIGR